MSDEMEADKTFAQTKKTPTDEEVEKIKAKLGVETKTADGEQAAPSPEDLARVSPFVAALEDLSKSIFIKMSILEKRIAWLEGKHGVKFTGFKPDDKKPKIDVVKMDPTRRP